MEELDANNYLLQQDLFDLFKQQLKKDFDSCSLNTDFITELPFQFDDLKSAVLKQLKPLLNNSTLSSLLYRIDISEIQIKNYQQKNTMINFEEVLSELIIKRILQKVILKKKFSQ